MIINDRMTASIEGGFVVFLIGIRLNNPWNIFKWLKMGIYMPKMLAELYQNPKLGLIHHESWFGRTTIQVQYWKSVEHLLAYAKNRDAEHLPAWAAFNRFVGTDGSVGIWHETYVVSPGSYESVYVNMPPFGLGKAGKLERAVGPKESAKRRLTQD